MPDYAYHWAPRSRRNGIRRRGLTPGALSRHRRWRPPFVAFSRDPDYAIRSADVYHPVTEPMDLYQVDLDGIGYEDLSDFRTPEGHPHDELRVYVRIPWRDLTYIATRTPEED